MSRTIYVSALFSMQCRAVFVLIFLLISGCMEAPVPFDARKGAGGDEQDQKANTSVVGGFINGYWGNPEDPLVSDERDSGTTPGIQLQKLEAADDSRDGSVFLSWTKTSKVGETLEEELKVMTYTFNAREQAYIWSDPANRNFVPIGITSDATETLFTVNKSNADGYALWSSGDNLKTSEFMGGMNHFMGDTAATLPDGHTSRFLTNGSAVYLVTQSHMMNGFGLNVHTRTAFNTWSDAAMLHRMGSDESSKMEMPHDSLTTLVDGQDNIRAIWKEQQSGNMRLMTSVYDTAEGMWGEVSIILDSTGDTHGIDLSTIHSMSASGEHGNANVHVAMFVDTADDEAVYTMDFDGTAWGHPMRRDVMGNMTMLSDVQYAVYHGAHVVAWIEDHMGTVAIKTIRFIPGTDMEQGTWGDVEELAAPEDGAQVSDIALALNHEGHAVAIWLETDSDTGGISIGASLQKSGMEWALKELIASFDADTVLNGISVVMREDGTPWIVWTKIQDSETNTSFLTYLSRRLADINDTGNADGVEPDPGSDPGSDPGTDPGTDPGAGGGADPGTGGGSDPGTNPSTGTVEPGTDYASGYWNTPSQLFMEHLDPTLNPSIARQQLQVVDTDAVFLSWTSATNAGEALTIRRAVKDSTNAYSWGDPQVPAGITASATMTQFTANTGMEGYALWDDAGTLKVSEFMEMSTGMAHFMGTATIGDGHAARILTSANGVYLVAQSHMMNGFGLDVYTRTGASAWSDPVQLHRMGDATNPMAMSHDDLLTIIDGNNNIRALWIETQADDTRLMTAVYDTTAGSWSTASPILDSAGDTHGIEITSIQSMSASGEHGNDMVHLVMFVNTADDEAIYTMDFDGTAWGHPMRKDVMGAMTMLSDVQYAVYHNAHMVAWVEDHMGMVHIKSLRFDSVNGWGAVEDIAMPAMGATIADLGVALNHHGDALAYWTETDADGVRILNALQAMDGPWAMKEIINSFAAGSMIQNVEGALHDDGTPWVIWSEEGSMGDPVMTMFTINLSQRSVNITDTVPAGTTPTDPGTDPGTGGGTDPGTGGGTDPGTGGGTDPGTGGGTDPGTGGGSDPGTGGGMDTGSVEGLWNTGTSVSSAALLTTSEAVINMPKVQASNSGNLFASWLLQSDPDATTLEFTQTDITVMRGVPVTGGGYTWSDPVSMMFNPVGYNAAATDTQFVVNPVTGDGIATWNHNGATFTSEFMSGMGHFMNNAQLPEGHAVKVLVDSAGQVYLVMQTHMMGGFGLSVYKRTAADQWSATPVQLHRMDMTDAFNLVNHFLLTTVDGQDNLRAVWVEEQAGVYSLQSASYDTGTDTWSAVSEIHAHDIMPNKLADGKLNGVAGSADLQLVLHQLDGMSHAIFAASYTDAAGWGMPMRLDEQSATVMVTSAPGIATNVNDAMLIAWVQTDSSMTASNSSGKMNMIVAKRYMPGMGWHAMEHIAHGGMMTDASAINVALNATGDATATWMESGSMGSHIIASHYTVANGAWSQKELIAEVPNADGEITAVTTALDSNNMPLVLWGVKQTDGTNDTLQLWRNSRLTAIADAQTGGTDPGTGGTDPGTGGTDPGTGGTDSGPGTTDPGAGGNDIPTSVNWTTPVMALQMMHSTARFRTFGPQVVLDDIGGTSIRMGMANMNGGFGVSLTTIGNHIVRSEDNSAWENILMGSGLLDDLSNTALIEFIEAVPTTGNLYGLIRDDDDLYLARYLPNAGWSKLEIPDVPEDISRRNLQLTTNDTGMVTLVWHELSEVCCVDIHAKHFMVATGWQDTQTLTVPAESVLKPHTVDSNGKVHVAWLVAGADGFDMKMATYTPMVGWTPDADIMNGPTGLKSALTKTTSSGDNSVVLVTDLNNDTIDAYVINNGGTWTKRENINQKVSGDGVALARHKDIKIISGGANHFMAAWREFGPDGNGGLEVRYQTAMIHFMTMSGGGMPMWHVEAPSQVGGMNSELESNLDFVLDNMGNAYAIWTSVDPVTDTDNVYVNQAPMGDPWPVMPELLASYDMSAGNYAGHASITINSLGKVGIAWGQHMAGSGMAMHHVWFVESQ